MPVPFGFSVGDFISGIDLLLDAVKSLHDTNGAQDDYKELGRELKHLRNGLEGIKGLSVDPTQSVQFSTTEAAVHDCLLCLDGFIQRNAKFSSLGSTPASQWTAVGLKNRWRMVQWALWKKADIARFRSQVQQHAEAIQMLLETIQINQLSTQGKLQTTLAQQSADHRKLTEGIGKNVFDQGVEQQRFKRTIDDQHKLVGKIRNDVHTIIGRQTSLAQSTTADYRKTRDQILHNGRDQEMFFRDSDETIAQLQADVKHTDTQVEMLMALEKSMARRGTQYQQDLLQNLLQIATQNQSTQDTLKQNRQMMQAKLDDIASMLRINQAIPAQVLLSAPVVLLDARGRCTPFNLEFIDSAEAFMAVLKVRFKDIGLRKIENGEFALEDTRRKRSLSLSDTWSTVVRPGQHISMSSDKTEIECANIACRLTYRRIVDVSSSENEQSEEDRESSSQSFSSLGITGSTSTRDRERANSRDNSMDDDIKQYTRVQILTQALTSTRHLRQTPSPLQSLHRSTANIFLTFGLRDARRTPSEASPTPYPKYPIQSYPVQSNRQLSQQSGKIEQ
ncbi:MAG: hypothetical protein ASARMPRED_004482 [Alectoria sarmentosa]|nr:MAG: hypothetical protein ASARMPRED_004482 [Alectoria sarmentosa]